jgi:hypothetical protein
MADAIRPLRTYTAFHLPSGTLHARKHLRGRTFWLLTPVS